MSRTRTYMVAVALALTAAAGPAVGGGARTLPADHPLLALLASGEIGRGREHRALLVVPFARTTAEPQDLKPFVTAREAHAAEGLSVGEPGKGEGRTTVEVYNWTTAPVLLLGGEVLTGGWRDRFLARTALVGPGRKVTAKVLPADRRLREAADRSRTLAPRGLTAPDLLRVLGVTGGSSAAVDAWLEDLYALTGQAVDRQPLAELYKLGAIADKAREYEALFPGIPDELGKRTIGAATYIGDRFLGLDLFATNGDFRANWPSILASAAFSAAEYEVNYGLVNAPFPAARDPERMKTELSALIRKLFGVPVSVEKAVDLGEEASFRRDDLVGRVLWQESRLVHAVVLTDMLATPAAAEPPPTAGTPSEESPEEMERRLARGGRLTEFERRLLERMRERRGVPEIE